MKNDLIKLKVKREAAIGGLADKITITFINACLNLDASLFEPLIEENQFFQDLDKYRILQSLKDQFEKVKAKGITKITFIEGNCLGCENGHNTHQFYGDDVRPEPSYLINKKEDQIQDIFTCNMSSGKSQINMSKLKNYNLWRK
jgi:hypothetical protein